MNTETISNDNRTVQYKFIRAELHYKIGFGEWLPMTEDVEPPDLELPTSMDLSRPDTCGRFSVNGGIRPISLPKGWKSIK